MYPEAVANRVTVKLTSGKVISKQVTTTRASKESYERSGRGEKVQGPDWGTTEQDSGKASPEHAMDLGKSERRVKTILCASRGVIPSHLWRYPFLRFISRNEHAFLDRVVDFHVPRPSRKHRQRRSCGLPWDVVDLLAFPDFSVSQSPSFRP